MWDVKITLRPVCLTALIHSLVVCITESVTGYVEIINASLLTSSSFCSIPNFLAILATLLLKLAKSRYSID